MFFVSRVYITVLGTFEFLHFMTPNPNTTCFHFGRPKPGQQHNFMFSPGCRCDAGRAGAGIKSREQDGLDEFKEAKSQVSPQGQRLEVQKKTKNRRLPSAQEVN